MLVTATWLTSFLLMIATCLTSFVSIGQKFIIALSNTVREDFSDLVVYSLRVLLSVHPMAFMIS